MTLHLTIQLFIQLWVRKKFQYPPYYRRLFFFFLRRHLTHILRIQKNPYPTFSLENDPFSLLPKEHKNEQESWNQTDPG